MTTDNTKQVDEWTDGYIAMSIDDVAEKYAASRPGFRLADYDWVGLPVYKLELEATFLEDKKISPIDEFVLRSVDAGLSAVGDISQFLGLDERITKRSMIELARTEDIALQARAGEREQRLVLTGRGRETLAEKARIVPIDHKISIYYDGMLRKPVHVGPETPLSPKEVQESGIREIPAIPARPPSLDELRMTDVREIVQHAVIARRVWKELLGIQTLERRSRFYRRAVALVYRSSEGNDVQVAFAIDGFLSAEHERVFSASNGPEKTGILQTVLSKSEDEDARRFVGPATAAEALPIEKGLELRARAEKVDIELKLLQQTPDVSSIERAASVVDRRKHLEDERAAAARALTSARSRMIGVSEHPKLLMKALEESTKRLLIISPWIRGAVVNQNFVRRLRRSLEKKVDVYIGYGLGEPEQELRNSADKDAERELQHLSAEFSTFHLKRFGDTHAKVLISDDQICVATSFNWLSFRGDPRRTFREEIGYLVTNADDVNQSFDLLVGRFR